jgi:RHS repeat-associated protein
MSENGIESESSEATSHAPSQFDAPQISLPKGGGAIRGIDEKFTANPATGTGSLTIPLALSTGRAGFGPQLSLNYDSGQGNGPFGIGWSLSLPKIALRTDNGLPCYGKDDGRESRYQQGKECDTYLLSGAEDLVPVLDRNEYGTLHMDEFERDGHRVRRYRPRIEGLFARIERWTCLTTGVAHWRSISRDNVLTVYGLDATSRIADPADPTHIFSWLICRSYDDRGNAIVYDYAGENDCGVDLCRSSERARSHTANRYLKRIRYGNRTPLLLDIDNLSYRQSHLSPHDLDTAGWMFEAVFDYGEGHYSESAPDETGNVHAIAFLEPQCGWATRKDSFSNYRSGFEVRTHRLCRRVLMYHHFEHELGAPSVLVRSTALHFREKSLGSFIERVVSSGHRHLGDGQYLTRSMPPLDCSYTGSPLEDPSFDGYELRYASPESLENLPAAVGTGNYRFVDLDGEGIAGVLAEQDATWFYKPNRGEGRLGPVQTVRLRPAHLDLASGSQQLMDMSGDGVLDIVEFAPVAGFYERTDNAAWEGFRTFDSCPVQDWNDPNLRFADLTGDGFADMLVTEDEVLRWHRSLGKEGFGPGVRVAVPLDEIHGPRILFADGTQSVYLADMSGDGLADIVRICNGKVCYWPNLGYGRFGAMVAMEYAPWFDEHGQFVQQRIRLADTDGSGTTDILYLGSDHVQIYLNEAGNAWSQVRKLRCFPCVDDVASVTVADFLGRGTACLLWSSALPGDFGRHIRYVDLMCGVKPHLLSQTVNNLGAETRITYASSTQFYLADKAAGTPWLTRLPFPVHVVEHIETYDHVSRNRFVTSYTYHHGFYDKEEHEFRGFGRVDQIDTEKIGALADHSGSAKCTNMDPVSSLPPVLTRTWFHTGVFLKGGHTSRHLSQEYYCEGAPRKLEHCLLPDHANAMLLEDTVLPPGLTLAEAREACRALKGSMLRQEIYALDGKEESCRPYTVTEMNLGVRLLQPHGPNRHAVLFTHAHEQVSFAYERKLYEIAGCLRADPRVSHNIALEVDDYGNVLKSVAVAYGRRLAENVPDFQQRTLLTLAENNYTNLVNFDDAYRPPMPAEQRLIELRGLTPDSRAWGVTNLFRFGEIAQKVAQLANPCYDIPPDDWHPAEGRIGRRLLKKVRTRYRSNDLSELLPEGQLQSMALPGENYRLATPGTSLRAKIGTNENALQTEGGYLDLDHNGEWWVPSGRVSYSSNPDAPFRCELRHAAKHFFIPRRYVDPFGGATTLVMDAHDLMPVETTDAVGNVTRAEIDYRVLAPRLQTDMNGNRSEVAFDILGFVAGTALRGKDGEADGDSLEEFEPDLTLQSVRAFMRDPCAASTRLLGHATTRFLYDANRYLDLRLPTFAATVVRETHESALTAGQHTRTQVHIAFSDGLGREIQKKLQAEPGPIVAGGDVAARRWIGSGWTVLNNKGKPVRKYEPFFSVVADFEFAARTGVSSILLYDPLGRTIATMHPNHTFEKVVFDPWRHLKWDANDTILIDPKNDPDIGDLVSRLPDSDYFPTWYLTRISGALGDPERRAALEAARHAATPTAIYFDSLGREVLIVVDNGGDETGKRNKYASLAVLDIEGNSRTVIDAHGRSVMHYNYDMLGRRVHQASMDAGERWTLSDIAGKPIRSWNSRHFMLRTEYDALRRPIRQFVQGGDQYERNPSTHACEVLFERTIYGDSDESALTAHHQRAMNLRGRLFRHFDSAGLMAADEYNFKGNVLHTSRQFASDYRNAPDWSRTAAFDSRIFEGHTAYDALNRPVISHSPDGSINRLTYNDAGLIKQIDVALRAAHCKALAWTAFIRNIEYNARGQRTRIEYGNGVTTTMEYDATTFRLSRLRTTRPIDNETLALQIFADASCIQDLHYCYDPVGNILEVRDRALRATFHDNNKIDTTCRYSYDSLYRLTAATGREHAFQSAFCFAPCDDDYRDYPFAGASALSNLQALQTYTEHYEYDAVGNFLSTAHRSPLNNWTRRYAYEEASLIEPDHRSNHLSYTQLDADSASPRETYLHDANGNLVQMPHLPVMRWDFLDRLAASSRQVVNCGKPETTYYVYDWRGQRVRKVTERANGSKKNERFYLGEFELFHVFSSDGCELALERETLHVMDDQQRVAIVETLTADRGAPLLSIMPRQRFQIGNHLGSASIELDDAASCISYEEYSPYGTTVFQAGRSTSEVKLKRYRHTAKERDEENGFTYHGARYYAPWIGRWTSADPSGIEDGLCAYAYVSANPIRLIDPSGAAGAPPGGLGHVAPWYQQINPRRLFGQIVTEAEHVIPRGVLKQLLYNPATKESEYTLWRYLKDPTVIVERVTALMKTHPNRGIAAADNARTAAAKATVAANKGVNLVEEMEAAMAATRTAIATTKSVVTEGQAAEAMLGQVGSLFEMHRLSDTVQKIKEFEDATKAAKSAESAAAGLKSVPKIGPIGVGLAVIGLGLTLGITTAQAATRPVATTTLDKIEHATENVRGLVDIGAATMSLHPTGGLIVLGATGVTLAAEKGIELTGGDERIVESGKAAESFAQSHGATEDQAQVVGAVAAGVTGIEEGVSILAGPIGWAHLGVKAWLSKK